MAKEQNPRQGTSAEPFISPADRPAVGPDTRVGDLSVRDLQTLLGGGASAGGGVAAARPFPKSFIKDKEFAKELHKDKPELAEIKIHKEKIEKFEKNEKIEIEFEQKRFELPGDVLQGGDNPVINQVVQGLTGLQMQMGELASELARLRSKIEEG